MSSPFDAILEGIVESTVDQIFGDEEAFDFRPMATDGGVNGRPVADPARAVAPNVAAIYDDRPMEIDESGRDRDRPGYATHMPQISVRTALLPWELRRGDESTRNATGEVFRIGEIEPDGQGRVNLQVTLIAREATS